MLALLTQTKVQRPWMQYGTGSTVIHFPLKNVEEPSTPLELKSTVIEACKRKGSKIPRMIKPTSKPDTNEMFKLTDSQAAGETESIGSVAIVTPVVRSTRTSRCRIKLAHPEWMPSSRRPSPSHSPSPSTSASASASVTPIASKREISEPQRGTPNVGGKRRSNIEPWLQLSPSVIEISDPLKNLGGRKQLLRLVCSDQKQINVPCQLINRYSTQLSDRQKEPHFCFSRPIQLDTISSKTLLRIVQWMQHHFHDDINQLQKTFPSLENAKGGSNCTWDETFLGLEQKSVLHLLLAANYLGINPLMEHAMVYFLEFSKQREQCANVAAHNECQTQTDFQQTASSNQQSYEQQIIVQTEVKLPQFVTTSHLC